MAILSLRAYSRHRGVALSAVQKAIETGRICREPDGRIDSEQADIAWERNTRAHATIAENGREDESDSIYAKARIIRARYEAALAKIKYEERAAQLVRRDEVEIAASETLRQFRSYMLRVPARVAKKIAEENNEAKVYEILDSAVRMALNEFADSDD